jgi:hypothetical protein
MTKPAKKLQGSGIVATQVGLPRWRLLYLIEKGELPGPSYQVPGRRLFTEEDVQAIVRVLASRPDLSSGRRSSSLLEAAGSTPSVNHQEA